MRVLSNLAAALVAAAVPLYGAPSEAAPLSQSIAMNGAQTATIEQVQYRHRGGRWIGPAAAGFAAGAIIGGAVAPRYYDDGYYAYGVEPGYGARLQRWQRATPQYGSCSGDRETDSGYPSWACR